MTSDDVVTALIIRNEHVLLPADVPRAVLDDVAAQLAGQRSRVLRPPALDVLTLPGLLAELVAHASDTPPEATTATPDLERGFELLTDPGPEFQQVVLMLDRADALDPAALRYVQFAAHGAPLRLLFAGGQGLRALLAREEFGLLRRSFIGHALSPPVETAPIPASPLTPVDTHPKSARTAKGLDAEAFPGGADAALEFAAIEKSLASGGSDWSHLNGVNPDRHKPDWSHAIGWHAPVSEPARRSTHWLLAGAGMAVFAAAALVLINSGLLASYLADMMRTTVPP